MKSIVIAAVLALASAPALAADLGAPAPATHEDGPAKSPFHGLYVDGGVGINSSNIEGSGFGSSITLGENAWTGHIGVGYDHMVDPHWVIGVFGRVHLDGLKYSALGTKLADTDVSYSIGGRVGFIPMRDWMVYGMVGYKFAELDLSGNMPTLDNNAWIVGGGLEAMLNRNWFLGVEVQAALGEGDNLGPINVETTDYTGTVRVGYRF